MPWHRWADVVDLGTLGILTRAGGGRFWRLWYRACGHTQEFPRDASVHTEEQAKREIQRHYASCLSCQLHQRVVERPGSAE